MKQSTFIALLLLVLVINALGLLNPVFTGDSALYASISKAFVESGDYLNIYVKGRDWLDKPHFPFWICAFSMELFGYTAFAYKLPSFLFFVLGLFYTYRIAGALYTREAAQYSVLILGSAAHIIVSNNDVRAEAILLGLVMGAAYHMLLMSRHLNSRNVIMAAIFSAAAVMTKGIFVLIIIYSATFGYVLFSQGLKQIFRWRWFFHLVLTMAFTFPELFAVYRQFDMHPEKTVFGQTGVSGVRFFLWDSQFGRFFNTGPIKGQGDPSFFLHTMLWAFAPWAIAGFAALFLRARELFRRDFGKEYFTFFGFLAMFLVFSISKFQLPHYTNILYPFLAIMIASFIALDTYPKSTDKTLRVSFYLYATVAVLLMIALEYFLQPGLQLLNIILIGGMLTLIGVYVFIRDKTSIITLKALVGVMVVLGCFFNLAFYPVILNQQAAPHAAREVNAIQYERPVIITYPDYLFEFYTDASIIHAYEASAIREAFTKNIEIVYAKEEHLSLITDAGLDYTIIDEFGDFHITELTGNFINYRTRPKVLERRFLLQLHGLERRR